MIFNFDGGDILVILLTAIAFVLSRRFDKTGRSLEKVRRYAEKSKSDLDAIVRERELGLKDLSVDLEVQEQTNREILNRAEIAREEILSRAEELEERVERIEAHERALEDLNELALRVDENLNRLKEESAYVDDVGSRLTEVRDKLSSFEDKDTQRFADFREETLGRFTVEIQRIAGELDDSSRQISLFRETMENLNARADDEVNAKISSFRDELEATEEDFRDRLRQVAEEGIKLEDDAFLALNEKIDSRGERLEANWIGGMNDLKDKVAATAAEIQEVVADARDAMDRVSGEYRDVEERLSSASDAMDKNIDDLRVRQDRIVEDADERLKSASDSMDKNVDDLKDRIDQSVKTVEDRLNSTSDDLDKSLDELRGRLENIVESKETDLLESFELRQAEYRKTVEERFGSIEDFIRDMDDLAVSLRATQKQTVEEIEGTFASFDAEMTERRSLEKARVEEEAEALKQDMVDLERGLDDLKSRAYDNVSEKLQVFEDEFFTDLKNRDEQMRAALGDWQKNADLELNELGMKAQREREETERRYSVELKQKLTELQSRVFGQFDTFQDQVDGFRDSLTGRIKGAEDDLAQFRDDLASRIEKDRESAIAEFEKAYDGFDTQVAEKFSKANKTLGQKLADYASDIDTKHRELSSDFTAARDEAAEWKERIGVQMDEAVRSTAESIETMSADFSARVSELQDEYAGKTEQLILESGEERAVLRREIGGLEESITRFTQELTEKSRDSLDSLKDMSEGFLLEFRKSSREARDESERKVKELRQAVQEARDRAEANRREMVTHTDNEYARLTKNLDEIEKRQREFIAETRVFERADEMKEALETDIAELNRQLGEVGNSRDEIRRINESYEKAVSLYDEVSTKLARFLSEQQKVELLEGKIAKIGSLTDSVDLKLERITDSHDTLQDFQIRLKQLEDLQVDLVARYDRLADKSSVLDAATEGVDKNFDRMTAIEAMAKDLAERLLPLRDDMDSAEERQARLEEHKETIEAVAARVEAIDTTIADLDQRMDDLQKAREWLARTETRLQEINAETQQQVKLLGTLSKRDGGRKSQGSPDMSTREVVVKLARQGWSSEEIAQNTKLSRGEVELILEITPKDGA